MNIIKLNAIGSTNSYLVDLSKRSVLDDFTVVIANQQTKGRGQQGAVWQSVANKSLTFSVFKAFEHLSINQVSSIAFAVSLGLLKTLDKYQIPDISINLLIVKIIIELASFFIFIVDESNIPLCII